MASPLQQLHTLHLKEMAPTFSLVDSTSSISSLVDGIMDLPINPPSLYFDLEGIRLSREGSISIFQLLVQPRNHVYLIDIHILGSTAFTTAGSSGKTFKDILQSSTIPKVCFDVRNDSDALFAHFGVALSGVQDIQLMENAGRRPTLPKRFLNGLAKCIEFDAPITALEKQAWKATKNRGASLFAPEKGGSYEVFNARPLKAEILIYCVQDVCFLPGLRNTYWGRLDSSSKTKVEEETGKRVQVSQSSGYQPNGPHMKFGPWQ